MAEYSLSDIITILSRFPLLLFQNLSPETNPTTHSYLRRLVTFIVDDPLILAVVSMFFVGFIVSIFIRIYHNS